MLVVDLGLIEFKKAEQRQKELFTQVKNGLIESALVICQHYPVITLGRRASKKNILVPGQELKLKGIQVYEIERGGDVTYHGPGQIIVYPILNLNYFKKDIRWYLRELENSVIDFLSDFGIIGLRLAGLTGVWVDKQKIASIGISVRNWITFHGVSINIKNSDLNNFRLVRPCGMDIEMICLETVLGRNIEIESVKENLVPHLRDTLSANRGTPFHSIGRVSPELVTGGNSI